MRDLSGNMLNKMFLHIGHIILERISIKTGVY